MRAPSRQTVVFLLLAFLPFLSWPQPLPDEPREDGVVLLPGRLPWGVSPLPTGELLAPCEDQTLSVFDGGRLVARWSAPARFSGPVSVAPAGTFQLVAAPLATGRVQVLAWDSRTATLTPVFAPENRAAASATAWGRGQLAAGWRDGTVELWSPQGQKTWSANVGTEVHQMLFDESSGVFAFGEGTAVLLDAHGRETGRWTFEGTPRGVLQSLGGDLFLWSSRGLWKKGVEADSFRKLDPAGLLGVAMDRQNRLVLTEPSRLRRMTADGAPLGTIVLPSPAVTAATVDDRGRLAVGTVAGLQIWTYDGRLLAVLDPGPVASALNFGAQGTGAWGSADWKVHLWRGFRAPVFGWPQDGGTGRSWNARRPASVAVRAANWADDAEFNYFYQLAASGEEAKQREVLERFEAKAAAGTLLETWSFANIVLLKVGRSGLTDLIFRDRNHVTNSWPALRLRAFSLLASTAAPEDRDELISLLQKEYDPVVAAQGTRALAQSGWDGDGKLMRLLADLRARMADQSAVADAVIDAARSLWLVNGRSADPVLVPLVNAVYQGPYPRSVKLKAQKFFQDLMDAP